MGQNVDTDDGEDSVMHGSNQARYDEGAKEFACHATNGRRANCSEETSQASKALVSHDNSREEAARQRDRQQFFAAIPTRRK